MEYNTGLAELAITLKSVTGGTVNNIGRAKDGKYFAVVYLPLMASKLLHFDEKEFLYLLFSQYYLDTYEISNVKLATR